MSLSDTTTMLNSQNVIDIVACSQDPIIESYKDAERWLEHGPDLPSPRLAGTSPTPLVFSTMAQRRLGLTDALLRRARIHDWAQHGDKAFWAHGSAIEDYVEPKLTESQNGALKVKKGSNVNNTLSSKRRNRNRDTFDKLLEAAVSDGTALTSDVRHVEKGTSKLDHVFAKIPLPPTAIHQPTAAEVVNDYNRMLTQRDSDVKRNGLGLLSAGDGITTEEAVLISELKLGKHAPNSQKGPLDAGKVRKLRAVWNCYRQPHSVSATMAMRRRGVRVNQAPFSKSDWKSLKHKGNKLSEVKHVYEDEQPPKHLRLPHSQDLLSQVEQEHVDVDGNPDLRPNESLKATLGNKRTMQKQCIEYKKDQLNAKVYNTNRMYITAQMDDVCDGESEKRHAKSLAAARNLQLTQAEPLMNSMLAQELLNVQMTKKRELGRADAEHDASRYSSKAKFDANIGQISSSNKSPSNNYGPDLVRTELPSLRKFCSSVKLRETKLMSHQRGHSKRGSSMGKSESSQDHNLKSTFLQNAKIGLNPLDIRVLEAEKLTVPFNMLSQRDKQRLEAYTKDSDFSMNLHMKPKGFSNDATSSSGQVQHFRNVPSSFVTRIKPGAPALRPPLSVICPPTYGPDGEPTMDLSRLMAYSEVLSRNSSQMQVEPKDESHALTEPREGASNEQWYGPVYYIKPQ